MSSNHCLIRHGSSLTNRHRCRTRCAGCSLMTGSPRATISMVTAIAVITAARRSRRSNGPRRGRGGCADAGRPCGTAWHCQPPRSRQPESAAAGPPVAAGPLDYQTPLARRRPPLARRLDRQCLPPVGRRRPARVEAALFADAAVRPEPDDRASRCSHAASAAVDLSRRCLSRVTASCGHRPVSDTLRVTAWFVTRRTVPAAAAGLADLCRPACRTLAIRVALAVLPRIGPMNAG